MYDLFINKKFQASQVKLLILGIRNNDADFGTLDLELELGKDIDKIRFSKNVELYENNEPGTIDDYLKNGEKFSFRLVKADKIIIRTIKFEDVTKDYIVDFIHN